MNIYFIGIGGIGVSSLARFLASQGHQVSGSDGFESEITKGLEKIGISVFLGHKKSRITSELDKVIYSAAISPENSELKQARFLGLAVQSYAQALGELTKKYFTIAICGSHGKSTTTALVSLILIRAGLDPTVILGVKLKQFNNSNFRLGKSKYLVIEADEYNKSFYNHYPKVAVITNIDKEHLDTYGSLSGVRSGFRRFLKNMDKSGIVVANRKDDDIRRVLKGLKLKKIFFSGKNFKNHCLKTPGVHNQLNAEAAWQTARVFGISRSLAEKAFSGYQGAWRRMERLKPKSGFCRKFLCLSDYAHHPSEVKATLEALSSRYPRKKIICVFQPHQTDRFTRLFSDYLKSFNDCGQLILLPVYQAKGRDNYLPYRKTSRDLFLKLKPDFGDRISYCSKISSVLPFLAKNHPQKGSIIVFMGAGNLDYYVRKKLGIV